VTKVVEFRDKSVDQLADQLATLKKEQFNLRFQRASGQLENTARFRVVRHDIARILTVLGERGASVSIGVAKGDSKVSEKPAKAKKAAPDASEGKADAKTGAKTEKAKGKAPKPGKVAASRAARRSAPRGR